MLQDSPPVIPHRAGLCGHLAEEHRALADPRVTLPSLVLVAWCRLCLAYRAWVACGHYHPTTVLVTHFATEAQIIDLSKNLEPAMGQPWVSRTLTPAVITTPQKPPPAQPHMGHLGKAVLGGTAGSTMNLGLRKHRGSRQSFPAPQSASVECRS